ncbi:unnamed protein product [Leuciscus chuanchicus]
MLARGFYKDIRDSFSKSPESSTSSPLKAGTLIPTFICLNPGKRQVSHGRHHRERKENPECRLQCLMSQDEKSSVTTMISRMLRGQDVRYPFPIEVPGKNTPAKGSLGRRGRYLHSRDDKCL